MGKKTIKNIFMLLLYAGLAGLLGWVMVRWSKPTLRSHPIRTAVHSLQEDSTLLEGGRQYGDVNLEKFIDLASRRSVTVFNPSSHVVRTRDSVTFSTTTPSIFFGTDDGEWWRSRYKDLPVSFPNDSSFTAAVHTVDSVEYIVIPYQILLNLANSVKEPPRANQSRRTSDDDRISLSGPRDLDNLPDMNGLIQTGGLVFQHVAEVLQENGRRSGDNRDQLEFLWRNAKRKWQYLHDPYAGTDTWRSATETIEAYYFAQKRGYTGDCDDFAILMASFARQLGFNSRLVCGFNEEGGHAYAEFFEDGKWVPMDWFSDRFGGTPFQGTITRIIDNI